MDNLRGDSSLNLESATPIAFVTSKREKVYSRKTNENFSNPFFVLSS